jgi:hypothetical protein
MRIVAMQAMIPLPSAPCQVPMTVHAAVRAVLIVAELRAMALRAQFHRIAKSDRPSIREA